MRGLRRKKGLRKRGRGDCEDCGGDEGGEDGDGGASATAEETQEKEEERDYSGELPTGLGRVEYLPVEWHTRFKGRLYKEGGGSGGAAGGSSKGNPDTSSPSGAAGRPRSEGIPGSGEAGRGQGSGATGGSGSGSGGLSIWDITLPRAPTLRAFTNDTLLDILYFMSPEYHQVRTRYWEGENEKEGRERLTDTQW